MRALVCTRLALMALTLLVGGNVSRAPAQTQPVRIVDANGSQIGSDVISIGNAGGFAGQLPRVGFDLDGRVFTLLVIQTGFRSDFPLDFTSPDCSGPPFVEDVSTTVELPLLLVPAAVAPPGQTVYLPVAGSLSQSITVGSFMFADEICRPIPAEDQPFIEAAFAAQGLLDLSTQFMPPFRVQLAPPLGGP